MQNLFLPFLYLITTCFGLTQPSLQKERHLKWRLHVYAKDNNCKCCRKTYCFHIKVEEYEEHEKQCLDTGRVGMGPEPWPTNGSMENRVEYIGPSKGCFPRAIIRLLCISWLSSILCCFSQIHCPSNSLCSWKTILKSANFHIILLTPVSALRVLVLLTIPIACFSILRLLLRPEDGCNKFPENTGKNLVDYDASRPKRQSLYPVVHLFKTDNIQKYKPHAIHITRTCYGYLPSASSRSGEKLSTGSSDSVWKNKACLPSSPADNFSSPCRKHNCNSFSTFDPLVTWERCFQNGTA
jgi:hypothetical protein